jgi:hypothetical protein
MKFGVVGEDYDTDRLQRMLEKFISIDFLVVEIQLEPNWGLCSQMSACQVILDSKGQIPVTNPLYEESCLVKTEAEFITTSKHVLENYLDCRLDYRFQGFWKNPFIRTEQYRAEVLRASENTGALKIGNVSRKFRTSLSCLVGHPVDVLAIGQTSSDMLSLLVDVAFRTNRAKPFVVCFAGSYGGGRGLLHFICPNYVTCGESPDSNRIHENHPNTVFLHHPKIWVHNPELGDVLALNYGELSAAETAAIGQIRKLAKNGKITILLLDLVRSDMTVALSGRFIRAAALLASRYGFYIAVDETLTNLTTGHAFSFQYVKDFVPDLFLTGKAFGACLMVATNKNVQPPCDPLMITSELKANNLIYSQFLMEYLIDTKEHIKMGKTGKLLRDSLRKSGYDCCGIGGNVYCQNIPADPQLLISHDRIFLPLDSNVGTVRRIMNFFPKNRGEKRSR